MDMQTLAITAAKIYGTLIPKMSSTTILHMVSKIQCVTNHTMLSFPILAIYEFRNGIISEAIRTKLLTTIIATK